MEAIRVPEQGVAVGRRAARWLLIGFATYAGMVCVLILAYSFVNPPISALMVLRSLGGRAVTRTWVPMNKISPHLARAVILSEDARFCSHWGIDWSEVGAAVEDAQARGRLRGASTITMQTMKNLFLWPGRDPLRKVLELPLALAADLVWSKRRTLEIYLNIAEWAPGVFGAEAAARHHFRKSAAQLSANEAALLAAMLPAPLGKRVGTLAPSLRRRAAIILQKMQTAAWAAQCVGGAGTAPSAPAMAKPARPKAPATSAAPEPEAPSTGRHNRQAPQPAWDGVIGQQPWQQ